MSDDSSSDEETGTESNTITTLALRSNDQAGPSREDTSIMSQNTEPLVTFPIRSLRSGKTAGPSRSRVVSAKAPAQPSTSQSTTCVKKNIRKQYRTLIEGCQDFEEKEGFDTQMETTMMTNINKGQQLFDEIGGGPGDMFLAFLHTRICSGMIKYKTINIGSNTSAFKVDQFLNSLMEKCLTSEGEYHPRQAVKCISSSATDCCKTLPHMVAIVGSFDRDGICAPAKEKKQRAGHRKRQFDETMSQSTQHEEVKINSLERMASQKTNQESFSREILHVLKTHYESSTRRKINLFEFTMDKTSFANTIESLFFVAFLVRDGEVSLYREKDDANTDLTLVIKPDKPPEKNMMKDRARRKRKKKGRDPSSRSQFILSFSAKKWKDLAAISSGEDIITAHKRQMNLV